MRLIISVAMIQSATRAVLQKDSSYKIHKIVIKDYYLKS